MKKIGIVVLLFALSGTIATSVIYYLKAKGADQREKSTRKDLDAAKSTLTMQESQIGKIEVQISESSKRASTAIDSQKKAEDELGKAKKNLAGVTEKNTRSKSAVDDLLNEQASLKTQLSQLIVQLQQSQNSLSTMQAADAKTGQEKENLEKTLKAERDKLAKLQIELSTMKSHMESNKVQLKEKKAQLDRYIQLGKSPEEITELQAEIGRLKKDIGQNVSTVKAGDLPLPAVKAPLAERLKPPANIKITKPEPQPVP